MCTSDSGCFRLIQIIISANHRFFNFLWGFRLCDCGSSLVNPFYFSFLQEIFSIYLYCTINFLVFLRYCIAPKNEFSVFESFCSGSFTKGWFLKTVCLNLSSFNKFPSSQSIQLLLRKKISLLISLALRALSWSLSFWRVIFIFRLSLCANSGHTM